jgi:hypothetical protein
VRGDFRELSVLKVVGEYYAAVANLPARWRQWSSSSGAEGGGGAGADATLGNATAAASSFSASAEALRGLLLVPWRGLQGALRTSFLSSPAWRADFLYYEKNMNPVFGLFFCDPHHPLSFLERLDIEFCVYGWVFFTSALFALTKQSREQQQLQQLHVQAGEEQPELVLEEYRATNANKYLASFLLVSAPSMMLRVFLFYVFLCPCIVSRPRLYILHLAHPFCMPEVHSKPGSCLPRLVFKSSVVFLPLTISECMRGCVCVLHVMCRWSAARRGPC